MPNAHRRPPATRPAALFAAGLVALALSACVSVDRAPPPGQTGGVLRSATGTIMGSVTVRETAAGIDISVIARALQPGVYGLHVHSIGRCDYPTFQSAGGHWNPAQRQHGRLNPQGTHAGDLGNITIAPRGTGTLRVTVPGRLDGAQGLFDADGAAVVLHARRDDEATDPSGNSGDRIACAVLARG